MARPIVPSWLTGLAVVAPVALFLAVYLPVAGRGFVQDDAVWVLQSRARDAAGVWALFHQDNGFYRPIVALTFAIDDWLLGAKPLGYGVTNVVLALFCAGSIVRLARAFRLSWGASAAAGALWLLNFQGIRMAVLWISGRTALVVTLAATAAATALVQSVRSEQQQEEGRASPRPGSGQAARPGWSIASIVFLAAALFSKEEAVLLPGVLIVWLWILLPPGRRRWRVLTAWTAGAAAVEVLYFLGRASTHAMTLDNAPSYYRLTFAWSAVAQNIVSYADRVATLPLAVTVLALLVLGLPYVGRTFRSAVTAGPQGPAYETGTNLPAIAVASAAWVAGMFGITVFVPVRSDLYAVLPSVGTCLVAAAVCDRLWHGAPAPRRRLALSGLLALLLAASPAYVARTGRYVQPAEFATSALAELATLTAALPDGSRVVLIDERRQGADVRHRNLSDAFGTLIDVAFELSSGRRLSVSIGPPADPAGAAGARDCPSCPALQLAVVDGHLRVR